MNKPQGVIFDMDGTLLDSMFYWRQAPIDCLREIYGIEPPADIMECMKELTIVQGSALLQEKFNLPDTAEQVAANINALVKRFYQERVQVRPGAENWLRRFQTGRIPMVIATSTDRSLVNAALHHTGLAPYFKAIFTCSEVGVGKGQPDVYEAALAFLGTEKAQTFVFEDSVFAMRTAKNAGFPVVGIQDASQVSTEAEARGLTDLYLPTFDAVEFPFSLN